MLRDALGWSGPWPVRNGCFLGVRSSFQFYEPHPLVMRSAAGAHIEDADRHQYVDFTMGYGALFTGHATSHPAACARRATGARDPVSALAKTMRSWPRCSPPVSDCRSGDSRNWVTEATMDAIRVARGITGRQRIVKVEGGVWSPRCRAGVDQTCARARRTLRCASRRRLDRRADARRARRHRRCAFDDPGCLTPSACGA